MSFYFILISSNTKFINYCKNDFKRKNFENRFLFFFDKQQNSNSYIIFGDKMAAPTHGLVANSPYCNASGLTSNNLLKMYLLCFFI